MAGPGKLELVPVSTSVSKGTVGLGAGWSLRLEWLKVALTLCLSEVLQGLPGAALLVWKKRQAEGPPQHPVEQVVGSVPALELALRLWLLSGWTDPHRKPRGTVGL